MWKLKPLSGKYYGTVIFNENTREEIKIWLTFSGDIGDDSFVPSDRELGAYNITRQQWDENAMISFVDNYDGIIEIPARELVEACDHFEDQASLNKALLTLEALNKQGALN